MKRKPFNSKSKGHVDGGHHGDGVEGEEEVGDEQKVKPGEEGDGGKHGDGGRWDEGPGFQPKLPDGLEQHGDQVDEVTSCQNGQKLGTHFERLMYSISTMYTCVLN